MRRLLHYLIRSHSKKNSRFDSPVLPEKAFYVIGDIHGRVDLLEDMFLRISNETAGATVVCVGDYVDRGDHSREVLNLLYSRSQAAGQRLLCLSGNHEEMMLKFLDAPERSGAHWLANGGLQTLASYGVRGISENTSGQALLDARDVMRALITDPQEEWLRALPRVWQSGNVAVVHAGADPGQPLDRQKDSHLIWGHPDFLKLPRKDGVWLVHGHTITSEPTADNGRIAIDTGAYATGRLTAAHITRDAIRFLST